MADLSKSTRVVLSFIDIFEEDEREEIQTLIKEIPTIQALQIIAHFSAQYHTNENNDDIHANAFKQWLGRLDDNVRQKFLKAAIPHIRRGNFLFINQPSCLHLIQKIILNPNNLKERDLTPEDELNLFKAYLIASEWSIKVTKTLQKEDFTKLSKFVEITLKTQFSISDLKFSREFYIQAYKAILFFEFCEQKKDFTSVLDDFIATTTLSSWREYLGNILNIYASHLLQFGEPNRSVINIEESEPIKSFLEYLALDNSKFEAKDDFISLREKPVLQIEENSYLFLNLDLFVDKIFEGILFDIFSSISGDNYGKLDASNFGNFKSAVGESFTEETLFYKIIDLIKQDNWISYSGQELRKEIDGEPDFYLRRRSKVFLFECKDTLIRSDTKNSYDFDTIQDEILKKLINGTDQKNKGVSQILSFVSNLDKNFKDNFDDFDHKKCKYYPIIVVTDRTLDEHGVNYIFNSNFSELIEEFGLQDYRIQLPVLIQLDDLIKFGNLFRDKKIKLNSILDAYIARQDSDNFFIKTSSFSDFLKEQAYKHRDSKPKYIDEKLGAIFE